MPEVLNRSQWTPPGDGMPSVDVPVDVLYADDWAGGRDEIVRAWFNGERWKHGHDPAMRLISRCVKGWRSVGTAISNLG